MKKLILSLVLSLFSLMMFSQTYDVTISGIVTDEVSGEPVPQQEMIIVTDSSSGGSFMYYNVVFTDGSGYYEDVMQVPDGLQGMVEVTTISCGVFITQGDFFSPNVSQLTFDFQVCGEPGGGDCLAMFYYFPADEPLSIQFVDESIGSPTYWTWDFGDGTSSSLADPLHIYPAEGEYLTTLTISSQDSTCYSTMEMMVRVFDSIPGGDCQAMFYYYPNNIPNSIQFIDESWGNPVSWAWEFGDGNTSNDQNPEHIYTDQGEYLVSLTITADSGNCTSYYEEMVWVSNDTIWPGDCQAMFFSYPADSNNSLTINFTDMSIVGGAPAGIPDSWYWDFGDGNTSTLQNPVHTYSTDGDYEVCLTITGQGNQGAMCESTECQIIRVGNWAYDCEAAFWYYPMCDTSSPNGGGWNSLNIQFLDMSFGEPDTWAWDFGDGITSTEQNPVHLFPAEGVYNVCLSISNLADSCESTYCEEIYVFNDTTMGCYTWYDYQISDLTVDFQAYLEGGVDYIEYTWDFGDGTTGTGEIISHTYAEDGIYEVLLSASSGNCFAEYIGIIWVGENFAFEVEGYIHLEDSMMADFADVHLMTFDTIGNGLINIATTQIDANGYYIFDGVGFEHCVYFVQSELTVQSAYFDDYVPTYHLDAINWEQAWPIFPFPMGWTSDVYMVSTASSNLGSGIISGTVTEEGSRELLSDIEILLLDQQGDPIFYSRTNDEGVFDFSELAYGTYVVYTEIVGIETIPFEVTLDENTTSISVNVIVKDGQAVLGIDDVHSAYIESIDEIYPNPVTENAAFNISINEPANIKVEIINQFGQRLYSDELYLSNGKHNIVLPTESISQGYYFVKITDDDNISTVRKLIKLR